MIVDVNRRYHSLTTASPGKERLLWRVPEIKPLCGDPSHYYRHLGTSINLINNSVERPGCPNYEKTTIRLVAHDPG
jgi:hypothetical protein